MAQVGFEPRPCSSQVWCFNHSSMLSTDFKKNMIVSKICVCQKRYNVFIFIFPFNLQKTLEGIIRKAATLQLSLPAFEDAKILLLG